MPTPKKQTASYSAWLRQRRQSRARPVKAAPRAVQIGGWILADENGSLVIIHRRTCVRTVLMGGDADDKS